MKKQKMHRRVTQSCTGVKIGCHSVMHRSHRRVPRSCTGVTACHSAMHRIQDRMSLSHAQESQESHSVMHRSHRMSLSHAQESRQHVTQPCTGVTTKQKMHRRVNQSCTSLTKPALKTLNTPPCAASIMCVRQANRIHMHPIDRSPPR